MWIIYVVGGVLTFFLLAAIPATIEFKMGRRVCEACNGKKKIYDQIPPHGLSGTLHDAPRGSYCNGQGWTPPPRTAPHWQWCSACGGKGIINNKKGQ